jgi:hypothetical protein
MLRNVYMEYEYDIAVSFAEEDREVAEDITNALVERSKEKIFHDKLEKHKLRSWLIVE